MLLSRDSFLSMATATVACMSSLLLMSCGSVPSPLVLALPAPVPMLDKQKWREIDVAIESYIAHQQMPGAVFWLERSGESYQKSYGKLSYEQDAAPVEMNTIFDAASLTKVIATTPAVMWLIEHDQVVLDAPLIQYLPECGGSNTGGDGDENSGGHSGGKELITIRHLLTHTSGLPAGIPATLADGAAWQGEAAALKLACSQKLTAPPGTLFRYSDINFILLGQLVQRVSGQPLNRFVQQKIFGPLGMHHTGYLPLEKFSAERIAPTQKILRANAVVDAATNAAANAGKVAHSELSEAKIGQGVVHDPTAQRIGGVAGHAGLFTTASDLARYARMMLNQGELDGVRVLSRESVRLMTTVQSPLTVASPARWRRSAGWDIDSPYARPRGTLFPIGSYGHTGFTGCILWIDPFSKTFYVFLSNRVYPDDTNKDKGNILNLYGTLGTLAAQSVTGFDFMNVTGALAATANPFNYEKNKSP